MKFSFQYKLTHSNTGCLFYESRHWKCLNKTKFIITTEKLKQTHSNIQVGQISGGSSDACMGIWYI